MKILPKKVEEYYNESSKYYLLFYADRKSLGFHYGFWNSNTKSRSEALLNQYREVGRFLHIQPEDRVLDAGCGVGGGSLWLAQHTSGHFVAITLSAKQVELGRRFAQDRNLTDRVVFHQMNYNKTSFVDGSFDKAFGIESFCYAYPDQLVLFREMYRLLKKGGRLVMSDGFAYHHPRNPSEQKWLKNFCRGWQVAALSAPEEITAALKQAGFKNIRFVDKTAAVLKSSRQIYWISLYAYPIAKILQLLGRTSPLVPNNIHAGLAQKKMLDAGLAGYGIFTGEK